MPKSSAPRYILASLSIVLLVVLTILVATHDSPKCVYSTDHKDTWQECGTDFTFVCSAPAIELKGNVDLLLKNIDYDIVCPWRKGATIVSYVALAFTAIFAITMLGTTKMRSLNFGIFMTTLGFICAATLLATFVLMTVDTVDGHNGLGDFTGIGKILETTQLAFIFSCILTFILMLMTIGMAVNAYKVHYKEVEAPLMEGVTTHATYTHQ